MKKELLCITCPTSCRLHVEVTPDNSIKVTGHGCKRGIAFAENEIRHPMRSLTTVVRTVFDGVPVIPVRTEDEIPKELIAQAMQALKKVVIDQRLCCGDTVLDSIAGCPCKIICTSDALVEMPIPS